MTDEPHEDYTAQSPLTVGDPVKEFETQILKKYAAIRNNREHSRQLLDKLSEEINTISEDISQNILCVAVCGSYARYDASQLSDLDPIVITRKGGDKGELRESIGEITAKLGLPSPNPKGVFVEDADVEQLIGRIGSRQETYDDLSRRLLLLLESRPLLRHEEYYKIIENIITHYSDGIQSDPRKNFVFLINDSIRYFRTICVNYAYTKDTEWGKWPIRNMKLRHSRVIMYFSLIACLGQLSIYRGSDKVQKLMNYIELSPLERLFRVYNECNDTGFYKIAEYYNVFLNNLSEKETRDCLAELDYENRYDEPVFAALKANSDALSAEILRFLFARRDFWSDRFFEYLVL